MNDDGEVECALEVSSDISAEKIQKDPYTTHKQLQQFFDKVPCYLTIQDSDLKITRTNRQFREDFGGGTILVTSRPAQRVHFQILLPQNPEKDNFKKMSKARYG